MDKTWLSGGNCFGSGSEWRGSFFWKLGVRFRVHRETEVVGTKNPRQNRPAKFTGRVNLGSHNRKQRENKARSGGYSSQNGRCISQKMSRSDNFGSWQLYRRLSRNWSNLASDGRRAPRNSPIQI